MNEAASSVVVEITKELIRIADSLEQGWEAAYFRFESGGLSEGHTMTASYISGMSETVVEDPKSLGALGNRGVTLLKLLGRERGVFLVSVDSQLNYNIRFEWRNLQRWAIAAPGPAQEPVAQTA
jgi:hypothetical protein